MTRRPRLLRVLVTVLALGVVLVAADLAARSWVTRQIAGELRTRYDLPAAPEVGVAGGSFLWQAARGRFEDVTVRVGDVPTDRIVLRDVQVRVPEVDVPAAVLVGRPGTVDLAAGTVRARVSYDDLTDELTGRLAPGTPDVDLARAGDAVRATTTVRIVGLGVGLAMTVRPELAEEGGVPVVRLDPLGAEVAGAAVPLSRAEDLLAAAGFDGWSVTLSDVPSEVHLDGLDVADDGVVLRGAVAAAAVDVGSAGS